MRTEAVPAAAAPPQLLVRRRLEAPPVDRRRILRAMRSLLVRRVLALFTLLVGVGMVHVWLQLQVVAVGYQLEEAHRLQQRLEQERTELEVERTRLRSPARIDALARAQLGMTTRRHGQVVDLR